MVRKRKQPETDGKGEPQSQVKKGVSAKAAAKVADSLVSSKYTGPFPDRERPTSQECTVSIPFLQTGDSRMIWPGVVEFSVRLLDNKPCANPGCTGRTGETTWGASQS